MKFLQAIFVILMASCSVVGGSITKNQVELFVGDIDRAFSSKNIELVKAGLSDDATISGFLNDQRFNYNKKEYLLALDDVWKSASSYSYKKLNTTIKIVSLDEAYVTETVEEKTVIDNVTYNIKSDLFIEIHEINNSLVVKKITVSSTMKSDHI